MITAIGGYLITGIRGYNAVEKNNWVYDKKYKIFGLWSTAMVSNTGKIFSAESRLNSTWMTFATGLPDRYAKSAMNVRCAKDEPRYTGATSLPSSQSRMVSSTIKETITPKEETISEVNIQVSPNPNSGIFKVILKEIPEGTVQIIDMSGNIILTQLFKGDTQWEVNIQNKPAGVYFVRVQSGKQTITKKIIKN